MPQTVYSAQDAIPEPLRDHYEEQDGRWVLKLEGEQHPAVAAVVSEANKKVGEFRNNNISANQALDAARTELEAWKALGMSPEDAKANLAKVPELESKVKGSKTSEDIQAAIQAALKPVTEALETERNARLAAEHDAASQALDGSLTQAGLKAGVAESALSDFLARGKGVFSLQDGQVVATKDGAPVYSSKRPGELLTVEEWAEGLQAEAPHLYNPSRGGGAEPGVRTGHQTPGDVRNISAEAISDNLEDVASGKAQVAVDL